MLGEAIVSIAKAVKTTAILVPALVAAASAAYQPQYWYMAWHGGGEPEEGKTCLRTA